ncbi:hypothetical protein F2Q68_00043469 [Brassica cretica]|uniref:Uncharacterized protein n=1 Tax=Brassica cretica TaxID=69181 RepID=A0A8S9LK87_BRACR|nr:hypothetical protein F2Q68_00043469 [Brassica cretica]
MLSCCLVGTPFCCMAKRTSPSDFAFSLRQKNKKAKSQTLLRRLETLAAVPVCVSPTPEAPLPSTSFSLLLPHPHLPCRQYVCFCGRSLTAGILNLPGK